MLSAAYFQPALCENTGVASHQSILQQRSQTSSESVENVPTLVVMLFVPVSIGSNVSIEKKRTKLTWYCQWRPNLRLSLDE